MRGAAVTESAARSGAGLTRRDLLKSLGFFGAAAAVGTRAWTGPARPGARLVSEAMATPPAGSDLGAIDHIVFLMMENRSYDHYFGAYPRGRGFDDHPAGSLSNFSQSYPGATSLSPPNVLYPFHLLRGAGEECTDDLTHSWGPQHLCWNGGRMDSFVKVHASSTYEGSHGAMTMGYYTREDLPFYYALADAFTLCDGYHSSILGPTHPNRLMANSGTIDPAGTQGGPVTDTTATPDFLWNCRWSTMQEVLEDAGVAWKVYHPSNAGLSGKYAPLAAYPTWAPELYNPTLNPEVMATSDHVLPYFSAFRHPSSSLYSKAFTPTFPNDFVSDVGSGRLPSVSWIIPPLGFDEHPSSSPDNGMYFTSLVLDALMANRSVWAKTVFFLMYDENDGWFDHVSPPTPPTGTPGEYLTASPSKILDPKQDTLGIKGPLGLGVRVPMLVVSPFSRGGHIASEVFDHTSQLKFVAERFLVDIPNLSDWRQETVGDLTSTLFQSQTNAGQPNLPVPVLPAPTFTGTCSLVNQDTETGGAFPDVPTVQTMPTQGGPSAAPRPAVVTSDDIPRPRPVTLKSSYNRLAQPAV
jgi:phospholipase C